MATKLRAKKLIQPRLQLRLLFTFLAMSALSLLFQLLLFAGAVSKLLASLPQDGPAAMERVPSLLVTVALISLGVVLPLTMLVGLLETNKIAGPIYRFTLYLRQLARGEQVRECTIRKNDQLQEFCELLNQATVPLRGHEGSTTVDTLEENESRQSAA